MTHEEAARRYLEASRSASALKAGSEGRAIHEGTMRQLEERHPRVRQHAIVGETRDFDEPLGRNEAEHQRALRKRSGLTNPQIAAQRRELRDSDYGRSETPAPAVGQRARGRRASSRGGRRARSLTSKTPGAVTGAGGIAMEFIMAGLALSLLYLVLTRDQVALATLNGITGGFRRLIEPGNNLFTPAAAKTKAKASGALHSGIQVGPSAPGRLASTTGIFGPLPNYESIAPTIP